MTMAEPWKRIVIGVIGAGQADASLRGLAREVGAEIARQGAILACGGLGGVMEAACQGAKEQGGFTLGILPGFHKREANPYVDLAIVTGMSYARNLVLVRTADALVAVGGGFGTLSEIAFALQLDKPVVAINSWPVSAKIVPATEPKEAVELAVRLAQGNQGNLFSLPSSGRQK